MRYRLVAAMLTAVVGAAQLAAQTSETTPITVSPCDDFRSNARALAEPWEDFTATFSNGAVRIALIDTIEPAGAPYHLLVLSPPYDEVGGRMCQVLSRQDSFGWSFVAFETLYTEYDPATGLYVQFEALELPEVATVPLMISFTLNQATGAITGQTEPVF